MINSIYSGKYRQKRISTLNKISTGYSTGVSFFRKKMLVYRDTSPICPIRDANLKISFVHLTFSSYIYYLVDNIFVAIFIFPSILSSPKISYSPPMILRPFFLEVAPMSKYWRLLTE